MQLNAIRVTSRYCTAYQRQEADNLIQQRYAYHKLPASRSSAQAILLSSELLPKGLPEMTLQSQLLKPCSKSLYVMQEGRAPRVLVGVEISCPQAHSILHRHTTCCAAVCVCTRGIHNSVLCYSKTNFKIMHSRFKLYLLLFVTSAYSTEHSLISIICQITRTQFNTKLND